LPVQVRFGPGRAGPGVLCAGIWPADRPVGRPDGLVSEPKDNRPNQTSKVVRTCGALNLVELVHLMKTKSQ
jgi:hypothetical protein